MCIRDSPCPGHFHSHFGVLLPNVCLTCTGHLALDLVYRWSTGLCWWLLVLVLYSSGCCRRRSLAISYCACRLVRPFATHQCDVGPGLGVDAGNRNIRSKLNVCVIFNRDHSALWICTVVKVLAHVFQASGCAAETYRRGGWLTEQLANPCR